MIPLLSRLLGFLGLGTGVWVAMRHPGANVFPEKFVVGFVATLLSGWCYLSLIPSRLAGFPPDVARTQAIVALIVIGALQYHHPQWLSGEWFGWFTPFVPFLLLAAGVASVARLARVW